MPDPDAGDERARPGERTASDPLAGVRLAAPSTASADAHPLSPGPIGVPRSTRRVSSLTDTTRARALSSPRSPAAAAAGYFDLPRRHHAGSVSNAGAVGSAGSGSPVAGTTHAVVAGLLSTPKRRTSVLPTPVDPDLLGLNLHAGPSRRRGSSPGNSAIHLFNEEEATPRRPATTQYKRQGTPLRDTYSLNHNNRSWAPYLDCLGRDELALLDTHFDGMNDRELAAFLAPYASDVNGGGRSRDGESQSTDGTSTPPPNNADAPLFPPSPPPARSVEHAREHPLRVLSRAVRELREVISRLEDENALLRAATTHQHSLLASGNATGASSGSGTAGTPRRASTDHEQSTLPAPVPLPSVAERGGVDMLHDSLADALSTSLTSPSRTPVPDDRSRSPIDSSTIARPKSPTASIISVQSMRSVRSGRVGSVGTGTPASLGSGTSADRKAAWGIWGWGKKPSRKGSMASLTPSMASALLEPHAEDDGEWRRGDGGSVPSFRAIFLATRILTPDPASILIEPARANATLATLAHALVSTARDQEIAVKDPAGARPRSRSRAASVSSANAPNVGGVTLDRQMSAGYGDQALAATVAVGRTLFSRGKAAINALDSGRDEVPTRRSRTPRGNAVSQSMSGGSLNTSTGSREMGMGSAAHSPIDAPARDTPPPSVELASIVPDESRPPTVLLSRQNLGSFFQSSRSSKLPTATRFESDQPPLTDRYGFIYDIQHTSMLKDASRAGTPAPISLTGHIPDALPSPLPPASPATDSLEVPGRARAASGASATSSRSRTDASPSPSASPVSPRTPDSASPPPSNGNGNHGRKRTGTLRSLAPAPARPTAAKDQLTVSVRGSSSLQTASSAPQTPDANSTAAAAAASRLTVSSLLDQLTDIHDRQQKARMAEWDAFLRKRKRPKSQRREQDVGVGGAIASIVALAGTQSKTGQDEYRLFLKLVRRGIPLPYRADVWAECSGARDLLVPGEYAEILAVHKDDQSPVMAEIEKDVGRTFPGNVFFGGDGPGVAKLRRVLVAYSWHNPAVGYCQGMNMLAATLLLTHTDEEQAFWVLHCMIERLLPPDFFAPSLLGSRADQLVLGDLVDAHVPRVSAHLANLGVDLTSVTFGWFLSLFTDCLPVETLFRVWDVFFVEGHDVLFRVAIAILKLNENDLCATASVTDLFTFIGGMTARLWSADKLIALQHSYKALVRGNDVQALVERHAAALQKEIDGE